MCSKLGLFDTLSVVSWLSLQMRSLSFTFIDTSIVVSWLLGQYRYVSSVKYSMPVRSAIFMLYKLKLYVPSISSLVSTPSAP